MSYCRSYFADKPLPLLPKPFLPPASDNIPRVLYEEKEMECHAKEETIQVYHVAIVLYKAHLLGRMNIVMTIVGAYNILKYNHDFKMKYEYLNIGIK